MHLLESGVGFPIVGAIMGWSVATTIRMATEVYGHIGVAAREQAIAQRDQYLRQQGVLHSRQISRQAGVPATSTVQ